MAVNSTASVNTFRQQTGFTTNNIASPVKEKTTPNKVNPGVEEQLRRLQDERDSLLRTGVFNTEDDMIVELERQIRAVIESIDNS